MSMTAVRMTRRLASWARLESRADTWTSLAALGIALFAIALFV